MILGRPELSKELSSVRFMEFYYTNEELKTFLKSNRKRVSGSRDELIERVYAFLSGGKEPAPKFLPKVVVEEEESDEITQNTAIEDDFVFGEHHQTFFTEAIGDDFVMTSEFLTYLENHAGFTYSEALDWYELMLIRQS